MFGRLGGWCHDHRRIVLVGWVLALFVAGGILGSVGSAYRADFNLPNVESRQGFEVLEEHFGGQGTGESGTVVFRSDAGVNDPSVRGVMEPFLAEVAEVDRVARVVSPYSEEGSNQISDTEGHRGDIGYAVVELDPDVTFENAMAISEDHPGGDAHPGGPADRAGRGHLRRVRAAIVGAAGRGLRHGHPGPGLRVGAGHGPAHQRRPGRHQHRHHHRGPALQPHHHPRLRHPARPDDRPRASASTTPCSSSPASGSSSTRATTSAPRCARRSTPPGGRSPSPASRW